MSVSQPIDFDRLFLKSTAQTSLGLTVTSEIPVTSSLTPQSPLELIQSLTSQFRSHFQEIKSQLSQKVENSAREMAKFEEIKREMKRQDDEWEKYRDVPNVPIQVYDWKDQKLKLSPRKNKGGAPSNKRIQSKSFIEESLEVPKRTVHTTTHFKKGTKEMQKFIYNKRFEKYLDHKYYRTPQIAHILSGEGGDRLRDLREEGNILSSHFNQEPVDGNLRQLEQYYLNEKDSPNFKGEGKFLKFIKKYEYEYRKQVYKRIRLISVLEDGNENVTKESVVRYLFDHVVMMMLYSVNPYKLVEEIANFHSDTPNQLSFVELSNFLLLPRDPPTPESYSEQSLVQAEEESFKDGKVVEPVIPYTTWLEEDEAVEDILKCFEYVDVFGKRKVPTEDLILRLKKYATENDLLKKQIYYITEINKPISIHRLIYEIEFQQPRRNDWTLSNFQDLFKDYNKLPTLPREQIIQNQMVEGVLDTTLLLNTSILTLLRQVYNNSPKYCDHYVDKLEYLDGVYSNQGFEKVKNSEVRRAPYQDINMETVEQTLARIYYEGDEFLEMDEIVDFFTNKGRPYIVNQRIKARNTEVQMLKIEYEDQARANQDTKDSEDEDIEYSILRQEKKRREFRNRQKKADEIKEKMKSITVPVPFQFQDKVKGESIRQRKLREMLEQKQLKIQEQMKPIVVARQVPWFVKQNLYQRFKEEQESLRRRRFEAHKSYLQTLMRPPAQSLMKALERGGNENQIIKNQYEFVARTMPWYCEIELLDRIVRDKLDRKERIRKEIQEREEEDGTPQGVKNMMQRQRVLKEKWSIKDKERKAKSEVKPKPFKRKQVPNFKKIFEQNGIQLQVKYVRPKEPYIQTWQDHKRRKEARGQSQAPPPPPPAKSTKKFDALVQLRQNQRISALQKKQKEKQDQIDRKLAQQKMAPKVQAVLRKQEIEHQNELSKFGGKIDVKKEFDERQRWYAQTIYKAFENVNERPLLIEVGGVERGAREMELESIERVKEKAKRKLRVKPIKKALQRTDDRKRNLELRSGYNIRDKEEEEEEQEEEDEEYDDDEYEEEESAHQQNYKYPNDNSRQGDMERQRQREREKERQREREKEKRKDMELNINPLRKQETRDEFEKRVLNDEFEYDDEDENEEGEEEEEGGEYYYEDGEEEYEEDNSDRHIGNRSF